LVSPAWGGGKADTVANLRKQAEKLSPHVFFDPEKKAKTLCICHLGLSGDGALGFLAHNVVGVIDPVNGGDEVRIDCYVPRYAFDTGAPTIASCVGGGLGTFWEIVK
jgi:hypothetical protein